MNKTRKLGRGVAIVGAGMSDFGMFEDKDSKDLFADAFRQMIASVDKGVDPRDIDALYLGNFTNDFFVGQSHWSAIISDAIGLVPRPATRTEGACASSALAAVPYERTSGLRFPACSAPSPQPTSRGTAPAAGTS